MQSVVYDSTLQLFMNKGGTQTQVYVCCKRNKEVIGKKKKVENKEEQEGDFIIRKSLFLIIYESLSLIISKRQCLII